MNEMNEDRFLVKKILGKREREDGKIEFEVEWKSTWETEETLNKIANDLLNEYLHHGETTKDDHDTEEQAKHNEEPGIDDLFTSSTPNRSSPIGKSRKSAGVGINAIISRLQKTQKQELAKHPTKLSETTDDDTHMSELDSEEEDDADDGQPRVYGVTGSAPTKSGSPKKDTAPVPYSANYPLSPTEAHEAKDAAMPMRSATYYPTDHSPSRETHRFTSPQGPTHYPSTSRAHSTSSIQSLRSNVDNIPQLFPPDSIEQRNLESMYVEHNPQHKLALTAVPIFKCTICSELFYEQSKFNQHMFMHEQVSLLKQDPPKLLKPGTYQCKFCSLLFDDKDKLRLHYSEEHEKEYAYTQPLDQLFKCSMCPLTFVDYNKWLIHSQVHGGASKKEVFILPKKTGEITGVELMHTASISSNPFKKGHLLNVKCDEDDNVFEDNQVKTSTSGAMTTLDFKPVNDALISKRDASLSTTDDKKMFRCNICDELFENEGDRANHSLVHVNRSSSLDCHICGKQFKHRTNLSTHLVVHSGVKPHQCHICLRRFTQKVNLQRHMHIHDGSRPFTCKFCLKSFTQRANLQRHILSHTEHSRDDLLSALQEIPNESEVNNAINESLTEAMSAISESGKATVEKPEYRCDICDKTFAQKVNLQKHMLIHTGSRPFQCYVCGKSFRQRASLQKHYTVHTNGSTSFICQTCNRLFVSRTNLQRHMLVHVAPRSKQCYLCDRNFTTTDNLERHFCEHIEEALPNISLPQKYFEQSTPGQTFRCATCDIVFDSPIIFSQHLQCHQTGFSPDTTPSDLVDITKAYEENQSCKLQCNACGLIFMSVAKLEQHMTTHAESNTAGQHAIGVMICPEAADFKHGPTDFIGNQSVQSVEPVVSVKQEDGVSVKSPTNRISRCPVCKEMFPSKAEMREHYSNIHLDKKPDTQAIAVTPPTSGAVVLQFEGTKYIATPMVTQPITTELKPMDFITEDTPGVITESEELLIRENEEFIKDNILGGAKEYETKGRYERGNYSCKICNRVLTYKYSLEKHMLLHAGSFPYKCTMCSKRFPHKASLDKHLVIHNGDKPFSCHICQRPFSQRSNLQRHQLTHTQNRDFVCEVCGKRFNHMASLKTHSLIHTGAKPFVCFICNKRFNQKGNLKRHVQTHRSGKRNKVNGLEPKEEEEEEEINTTDGAIEYEQAVKYEEMEYDVKMTPPSHSDEEESPDADLRRSSRSNRPIKRSIDGYDYEDDEPLPTMIAGDKENSLDQTQDSVINQSRLINNSTSDMTSFEMGEEDILTVVPSDALEHPVSMTTNETTPRQRKQTYPCDQCSKLFISDESLEAHKRSTHHIVCDVCGKKFSQKANLLKHKLIHLNKKPFECRVCHKAFRQKANLQRHELIHNKDRKTVNCSVCHKVFRCTWSLKQHMKGHAAAAASGGNSESFGCSICGKTFRQKTALQKHFDIHNKHENNNDIDNNEMLVVMKGEEDYDDDGAITMVTKEEEEDSMDDDDILTVVTNENNEIQVK